MIHPDHFGFPNYEAMTRAVVERGQVYAPSLGIELRERKDGVKVVITKTQGTTITWHHAKQGFDRTKEGLESCLTYALEEMLSLGVVRGFQVEDKDHQLYDYPEGDLLDWDEAKAIRERLNEAGEGRWYIFPLIGLLEEEEEEEEEEEHLDHSQTLIKSMLEAKHRNLNTCTRSDLISLVMTGIALAENADQWHRDLLDDCKEGDSE